MQKWEYKILKFKPGFWGYKIDHDLVEASLNEMGEQGWEVAGTFDVNSGSGASVDISILLKRPKQ